MKCVKIHDNKPCENEAGNHNYPAAYSNICKRCLDDYWRYEAHLTGQERYGFKPEDWDNYNKK